MRAGPTHSRGWDFTVQGARRMDTDPDPADDSCVAAIDKFEEFGLSAYAARTFVALVSVLVNGSDAARTDPRTEIAIWGAGETNSLVVVLRAIFTWRLRNVADDSGRWTRPLAPKR